MIYCIIPAYNESKNIVNVIQDVLSYVDRVVIVDDCSSDNTCDLVRSNFNNSDKVILLKHFINRGQGASLQTGNEFAKNNNASIIVHFDGDNQFQASDIEKFISILSKKQAQVVLGSRFLEIKSNLPFIKKNIVIPLAHLVNSVLIGKNELTDPQSGFRAFRSEVLDKISVKQDRMAHCSEILEKIIKNKLTYKEVPIKVTYHEYGQRFSGGVKIVKDLLVGKFL